MAYTLNTLQTVKNLTANSAFTNEQAELIVNTVAIDQSELVTKPFLRRELENLEQRFDHKFDKLETTVELKLGSVSV